MKKRVTAVILTAALAVASLAGCGNTATSEPAAEATGSTVTAATEAAESTSTEDKTITVAASATPHAEILEQAKSILAEQGWDLQVTVFDDYLQAAAEGVNMASPDVSVEDAKGMIVDMMNSLVEEMVSSFDVTPLQTEDGSKLSDQIQQMLDEGATINGTATVNADGTMTENVTVVNGESTVVVDMSFDGTAFNYVVTEDGTEIMNANGTITAQDNDFGMDMTTTADGETVNMNVALTLLDNGLSIASVSVMVLPLLIQRHRQQHCFAML